VRQYCSKRVCLKCLRTPEPSADSSRAFRGFGVEKHYASARELFKPSNDAESLAVSIKNHWKFVFSAFCGWHSGRFTHFWRRLPDPVFSNVFYLEPWQWLITQVCSYMYHDINVTQLMWLLLILIKLTHASLFQAIYYTTCTLLVIMAFQKFVHIDLN